MPRKTKVKLSDENVKEGILTQVYNDAFTVKNHSLNILKNLTQTIYYSNKEDVIDMLIIVQKQMDIINHNNEVILKIQEQLNG